jgi:ABC-type transport system involved in multi-copper enzyme maturation permease subunit
MTALAQHRRGGELRDAVRAEWTKFRSVRGWLVGLVLAVLLLVLFSYLQAHGKHTGYCTGPGPNSCLTGHPYVPNGPDGEAVADAYELVARPLTGDGTITARITSLSGRIWAGPSNEAPSLSDTRPGLAAWSKAGLLITPTTRQGAAYAAVMATGGHGVRFQDDYTHDSPGLAGSVSAGAPRWLRLTRTGDTITGYDSIDGRSWHRIGRARLAGLPRTVSVGLFATSPQTYAGQSTQATAAFERIALHPARHGPAAGAPGGWRATSIGIGPRDFYPALGRGGERRAGASILVTGSGDIAPAVADAGPDTASDPLVFGLVVAVIVLIVIGAMFITSEYRRGLIRTTLAATPRRGRVLAAKAAVIGAAGFAVGAVASVVAIPLGLHLMRANGNYVYPADPLTLARVIAGSGLLIALSAVAVLGTAAILRRSPIAILVGVVVFVLPAFTGPGVLGGPSSGGSAATWLYTVTPAAGFSVLGLLPRSALVSYPYTMANGYYPLPPWAGLLVLCAWAGVVLRAAQLVLRRRDA